MRDQPVPHPYGQRRGTLWHVSINDRQKTMLHARIEDRGKHADYLLAVERARAAGRTPPARYRVRWRDESGTSHSLSLPTPHLAAAVRAKIAHGLAPVTLSSLVDRWSSLPVQSARPGAPRFPNRRPLDLHVLPRLGRRLAITITRTDVERLMADLHAEGRLSAATINSVLAALKRVLEHGVRNRHLPSNPALGIRPLARPA
ncbi:hypothetical protein [Kitasatospora sp. NPDC087314]|uniref:hypothetical protein n=1 Tax=Kitasatospora sp. NPDC087314 TaxID=3364068 RepID=UPI003814C6A1